MKFEQCIRDAVLAGDGIPAVVGDRVRPLEAGADDVRPFVTYTVTGTTSIGTIADGPADYENGGFELGIFADTYAEVAGLSRLLKRHLDDLSFTITGFEMDVLYDEQSDIEEAKPEGEEKAVYLRTMTFRTLHRETA